MVSRGQGEVGHNKNKSVNVEYKPRVPYPNPTRKDRSDEQFDAADPHIVTTKSNEEIPLTVLSIFPFGTVEVSHPKFGTFKVYHTDTAKHTGVLMTVWKQGKDFPNTGYKKSPQPRGPTYTGMGEANEARHGCATRPCAPTSPRDTGVGKMLDAPKFKIRESHGQNLGNTCSKASALLPSLRYLHAILAHTLIGRRESSGVVNTHDAYFLWWGYLYWPLCYSVGSTLRAPQIVAQESSLTLIGQMSPQCILRMLSMRMIKKRRGTYPSQYCLIQSTEEEAPEDITDDVPPQHEDLSSQPPLPSRPVHTATSYADISERLTQFEQQCFQQFDNIDATL
ncbi:hypothetical protein GOBAR_AA35549 [Gossypium barbadense]|uniref:Uncharacterized protein n=1 Tax=Gossypium barbadense TaxID=3634 RepID=A0A2P5W223_GOSBA|nr:hypothetical protein GOBAR_AA35549 [Gossypium barbadense]